MSSEEHFRRLERMYARAACNRAYGAELSVEKDRAEVHIAAGPEHCHAGGTVHGSVYFKALDDAAYFAAQSRETRRLLLTSSFTLHLLRAVPGGRLRAVGRVLHRSRASALAEAELFDERGKLLARGTGTLVVGKAALEAGMGYA